MTSQRSHKDSVRDDSFPAQTHSLRGQFRIALCTAVVISALVPGCTSIGVRDLFSPRADESDQPDPVPLYRGQSPMTRRQRQLQALIDHELAGTSVEERRRWLNELKYLDLTTARGVLQQRRQTLDRQKNTPSRRTSSRSQRSATGHGSGPITQTAGQNPIAQYSSGTFGHSGVRRTPQRFPPAAPPAVNYTLPNAAPGAGLNSRDDHGLPQYPGARNTGVSGRPASRSRGPRRIQTVSSPNDRGPELAGPGLDGPKPIINPGQAQIVTPRRENSGSRAAPIDMSADEKAYPLIDDQSSGSSVPANGLSNPGAEFGGGPAFNSPPPAAGSVEPNQANVPFPNANSATGSGNNTDSGNPFEPDRTAANPDSNSPNLRNRISRWGARLGFGGEEPQQANQPIDPTFAKDDGVPPREFRTPQNVQQLISTLEQNLSSHGSGLPTRETQRQEFIRQHVQLRLLYLMNRQPARAFEAIPGLPPAEQEFWQQMLWGLSDYFDIEGSPERIARITGTVEQLESAVQRLKQEAQLRIHNLNFCRKIDSYGSYERFRRDEFSPGQPILVYSEVENFRPRAQTDGRFKTLLNSTIEILEGSVDGRVIDTVKFKATEDFCRNRRRDYFHSYELTIPQDISRGTHVLRLSIEDPFTRKVATETMTFTVR